MGLLSETVIMNWNSKNKKRYEDKGYIFTRMETQFEVKTEHLPDNSIALVNIQCDICGEKMEGIPWVQYKRQLDKYGYCYCYVKKVSKVKRDKKIKNFISFGYWCIKNLPLRKAVSIIACWDEDKNKCDIRDIRFNSHGINGKGFYFKCARGLHASELKSIHGFIQYLKLKRQQDVITGLDCKYCNSIAQYGIDNIDEDFLKKYWDYDKNIDTNPWEISRTSQTFIWIKCQEKNYHESYRIQCHNFARGKRCSYCFGNKVHPLDSLGKFLEDKNLLHLWSDKNIKTPYEYKPNADVLVWWKCADGKHEDYRRGICNSNTYGFRCPECVQERKESFLQEKVRLYLENLGQTILHEKDCTLVPKNPKTKYSLPFDNEVLELKLIIEVHGSQHYEINTWHKRTAKRKNTNPEYELHMQKVRDRYKKFIAYKRGYQYIAIPYTSDNDEEEYKILIDNKIKEILSKA